MKKLILVGGVMSVVGFVLSSCGTTTASSSTASSYSAEKPSAIIKTVGTAVSKTGAGISVGATSIVTHRQLANQTLTSANCDTHGDPKVNGASISQSNVQYPGILTYCKMTVNDGSPDTVQGAFETPRGIACAIEKAGITFDGVARSTNVTLDTDCFTQAQLTDMGVSTFTATVTGTTPASFNSYYDKGVRIQAPSISIDYTLGTKITGNKIEFASMEAETNRTGAFAGSFDTSTGELRYEGRMERIDCSTSGSCGWNRHIRIYADLAMSNGSPTSLESVSFAYSNVQAPPGQTGYGGVVVSASGNPTTGIKARAWQATNGASATPTATSQYNTIGNWSEVTNTYCYTSSSETATTCGTGLPLFTTDPSFVLTNTSHKTTEAFGAAYAGATYTTVDLNSDTQN